MNVIPSHVFGYATYWSAAFTMLSVCPSVTLVRRTWTVQDIETYFTTYDRVYGFLSQNLEILHLRVHQTSMLKRGTRMSTRKIRQIIRHISETVKIWGKLPYLHMESRVRAFDWYRKRWQWMTLNGIMAVILRHFTEFRSFGSKYVTVVKVRPTLSATRRR